jgi:general secretion pathway protein A
MAMYLDFYGLAERPFSASPDPKFLYLTPRHQEALAQLRYGVHENQGLVVLTGAVGTGKTTLLRALCEGLGDDVAVAFISNCTLTFEGLLDYMLAQFDISISRASEADRFIALNKLLLERHKAGKKTVLILDEAQHLSVAALEKIRLLSNFETSSAKLLHIVLVGQPELRHRLAAEELRSLRQRIALSFSIEPLPAEKVRDYVRARLRTAGARDHGIFTDRAIAKIAQYSQGVPRVINTLCHHCLLIGYADQKRRIVPEIVEEARGHLIDTVPVGRQPRRTASTLGRWAVGTLLAACAAGLAVLALSPESAHLIEVARSARELFIR